MKNTKNAASALLGLLALAAAAQAAALDSLEQRMGGYMGVSLGNVHYPKYASVDLDDVVLTTLDADNQSLAWSVNFGYWPTKYFGAEVGWLDLGKATAPLADVSGRTGDDDPSTPESRQSGSALRKFRDAAERGFIVETLRRHNGNITQAAAEMGVGRTYLHRRLHVLKITRKEWFS